MALHSGTEIMNMHTRLNETSKTNLLSQKAVLASITIGGWSARKLDRQITQETNERHNAKNDAGRYNKLLVPTIELDPINKVMGEARQEHYRVTMPWMDDGARILPTSMYIDYMTKMRELREQHRAVVKQFIARYPAIIASAPERLGSAFNITDFPDADRLPGMFYFDIKVLPCPDASDFRVDLSADHLADIRSDMEERMKATLDEAMKEPVTRIIDVVGRMADRLKNYKPKVGNKRAEFTFRDSLVENVRDLVGLLPSFNLTGDKALSIICQKMTDQLTAHDAETLRNNAKARRETAAAAESILAQAQALMG